MSFNFAEICDAINEKQEKIDKIKAQADAKAKPLEQEVQDLEQQLILAMQAAGLQTAKGKHSIADLKDQDVVSIKDYAQFEKFLYRQKALHLLQRRISVTAYREMRATLGKDIPGLRKGSLPKINVRRA